MYSGLVKAVTITMPEELDAEAAAEARRLGISKSELIRRSLTAMLPTPKAESVTNIWLQRAGFASTGISAKPGEINEVVYDL